MSIKTKAYLQEKARITGDTAPLETYEEIYGAASKHDYKWFCTYTFKNPIYSESEVVKINSLLKHFILKRFYSHRLKKADLKFLFINEKHRLRYKFQARLHGHFLITEPIDTPVNKKLVRSTLCQNTEDIIKRELSRIDQIGKNEADPIRSQPGSIKYLLKSLKHGTSELFVDYENSDINFNIEK